MFMCLWFYRPDELCIAKYKEDGLWYRGRCLEVVGDGYPTILFIDYGNISMVHIDDIRRYPTQFTYPIYTSDCEILGNPNNSLLYFINEFLCNIQLKIHTRPNTVINKYGT